MNTPHGNDEHAPDRDIARLLGAAGPREAPPEELEQKWKAHFREELAQARQARRARRLRLMIPLGTVAASVLVLALVLNRPVGPDAANALMRVVAVSGSAQVHVGEQEQLAAAAGLRLSVGATLETAADGRLGLSWAGFDVRLNEQTRLRLLTDRLQLEVGEVYISNQGQRTLFASAAVETPIATVSDIGTQFKVRYRNDELTASVRDGSVVVQTAQSTGRADATSGVGRTVLVRADGAIDISKDTSDWTWIYPVAQRFELEGHTVLEFLQWSTAESGRALRFVDEAAELAAGYTRLSGNVDMAGLNPETAVALVLSTTRFEARPEGEALLVSRRSE